MSFSKTFVCFCAPINKASTFKPGISYQFLMKYTFIIVLLQTVKRFQLQLADSVLNKLHYQFISIRLFHNLYKRLAFPFGLDG